MENNINLKREQTKGVIIHNDAGYLNGSGYKYLESYSTDQLARGFAHYYVAKGDIYKFWDDSKVAWHSGNFVGNTEYIGVEATNSYGLVDVFLENEQETFKLVAQLLKKYGLEPNRETVRLHREFRNTSCPHRSWELHGQDVDNVKDYFIQEIKKYYGGGAVMAQKSIFPMTYINVTQGPNGQFSHKGLQAMDLAGKDTGIDPFVAPFDVRCISKHSSARTNDQTGVVFESTQPIQLTDGTTSIIHFVCWHDGDTSDVQVGGLYKQGSHIYDEGTAGYSTGNHVHVEFGGGYAPTGYPLVKNQYGSWGLTNSIEPHLVLTYNDGNVMIDDGGVPFIKDGGQAPAQVQTSAPQSTGERVPQSGTCKVLVDTLNVRTAPSTSAEVVATYSKDETFTYDSFIDAEGIRWVSYIGASGNRRYIARRTLDNSQIFTSAY